MDLDTLKMKLEQLLKMIDKEEVSKNYDKDSEGEDDNLSQEEMSMVCNDLDSIVVNAIEVKHLIQMTGKAPPWVRSKVSVCSSKMSSIRNYFVGKITDF